VSCQEGRAVNCVRSVWRVGGRANWAAARILQGTVLRGCGASLVVAFTQVDFRSDRFFTHGLGAPAVLRFRHFLLATTY
jgi:hypothetical protein